MRRQYLTLLLTVLMSMVATTASAYDFEAGGIYYNVLTSTTVAVTYSGSSYEENPGCYTGSVAIPAEVTNGGDTYQVVEIEMGAFWKCTGLTAVTLPCTLKTFGDCAFAYCSSLTSVTLPRGLENLGIATFSGCSMLKTVTALMSTPPAGLSYMMEAPESCKLYVRYGTRDAYIAADGWKTFAEIIEMDIPSSAIIFADALTEELCTKVWDANNDGYLSAPEAAAVKDLGTVFKGQPITSFQELSFFIGLTYITDRAFEGCTSLNAIDIPNKVTTIGSFAFSGCSGLTSVTIPNGVKTIESAAFGYTGLSSLMIPKSVTSIDFSSFFPSGNLTSIEVEKGNPKYDSRNDCNALIETATNKLITGCANTTIPDDVMTIGYGSFWGCNNLEEIVIPYGVTKIDEYAFDNCSQLQSVTIPSSVTSIGTGAFDDCENLNTVTVGWMKPLAIDESVFTYYDGVSLFVPNGCSSAYASADVWRKFSPISECAPQCPTPTIAYKDGKLSFSCELEDVTFVPTITPVSATYDGTVFDLTQPVKVSVFARKEGYLDSDKVTQPFKVRGQKGDVNEDGKVTITDAVNVVDIILAGE